MKIKNWTKFQHFKDRRPPWIKVHRDILEQLDINLISDCSFRVLIGLWLLASEDEDMEGNLPPIDDISFRLRKSPQVIIQALQELSNFIVDFDINMISERYQLDVPETETETETETYTTLSKPKKTEEFELKPEQPKQINGVPYQKIIDLYHEILPELRAVRVVSDKRKRTIKARWGKELKAIDSWQAYFHHIRGSAFLMGKAAPNPNTGRIFEADFDWITKPENIVSIVENKYHE